ncbi:phosphoadenosine phosphosulfate reductase family protein [Thiohalorhabdus methylotrophus]|uniref:Phosphoadenosine phosphosulfate reductase family protein n=1 Tax=Thiohalorhabdus methylotrophus TaxID=3242694 RepID=A0ABV4TQE4_9GAMM
MATLNEALETIEDGSFRHIVNISGGKDSAALAIYLAQEYPQLPAEYVFCDTGVELPETYEYLDRLEAILGQEIVRLNALDLLGMKKKPGRNPFDIWLNEYYGGYLPNPGARWCTRVLKIKPFEDYIGEDRAFSYIGIRGDEDREGYLGKDQKPPKISDKNNIVPVYPFKDDELGIADIKSVLEANGVGLPDYYEWRSRSGCYFCFYQQLGEWQGLQENHPELFEKAKKYEKIESGKHFTWNQDRSLGQIENLEERYQVKNPDEIDSCAICHL